MLKSTTTTLVEAHDLTALDLDGVVYVGRDAVPEAAESLSRAREAGQRLAFVTNNAARTPESVAQHLRRIGVQAAPDDVVTSAQAAAAVLAEALPSGSKVYLIGGPGLEQALTARGLVPVTEVDEEPVAVAQGYGPDVPWHQVVTGAILVRSGVRWVASNTDMTIPTAGGIGPGNGTLVRLVADFAGRDPDVAGKPSPPLLEETLRRVGGEHPLFVGDRLDTDILGARNVGWESLLVLTGVTGLPELAAAPCDQRPSYLAPDLRALLEPQPVPDVDGELVRLGGWTGRSDEQSLTVSGDGSIADWWRVAATTAWAVLDRSGSPVDLDSVQVPHE